MEAQKRETNDTFKATNNRVLLPIAIFILVFVYRITILLWQTYPPGSDIGFHAGVINSITHSGNTNFLWNSYQMGGEIELEFPGYHIFTSQIILMTGLPNYLAQATVVALFSSLVVLAVFLVTRTVWNKPAAYIAAFLVAISWFDIEILCWGGYPNITVLLLIPLTFYMFLNKDKFTRLTFVLTSSFLVSSILLTHSLSAVVFIAIIAMTSLIVLAFPRAFNESRKTILWWLLPFFIGAIFVSPFLAAAAPVYLSQSSTIIGSPAIEQALIVHRTVPFEVVLALFACIVPFFLLSKKLKGHFLTLPIFLLIMWLFVPLLLTQDYLVGLYVDSIRFLYFLIYPIMILFAVVADYSARYLCSSLSAEQKTRRFFDKLRFVPKIGINPKVIYAGFLICFLIILFIGLPIFRFPWDGVKAQGFYQVMDDAGYQSIQWVKQNTPVDSVFVSEMGYGWWLAGFGQRPTITDIDLQALTLSSEVNLSRNASYLLDTDYLIDNGYIQVREDGGYIGRHNPLFLADLNSTNIPYPFFQFDSSQATLFWRDENGEQSINIVELPVASMQLVGENTDSPSIIVYKGNSDFSYSETVTVTKGQLFANLTITIQSNKPNVSLGLLNFSVSSPGEFQQPFNNSLGALDSSMKECGQLIFAQTQPSTSKINTQNPGVAQLSYNLQGKLRVQIQILVGAFAVTESDLQNPDTPIGLRGTLNANLIKTPTATNLPITTFNYKAALQEFNVSYVVNSDFEVSGKFADDPMFSLVFMNDKVAIFKAEATFDAVEG